MIEVTNGMVCPSCESIMKEGYLSYCSGAVWHDKKPKGLGRLFWSAFSSGVPVYGSFLSSLTVSSVAAWRCPNCSCITVTDVH
jgi:hypothetical protein